jgi:hypothetical protein
MDWTVLIHIVVVLGVGAVCPLALGRARDWYPAAIAVGISFVLPVGPLAAVPASVWFVVAAGTLASAVSRARPRLVARTEPTALVVRLGPPAFSVVAALALVASRAGTSPFGIAEPIVELTAVHFTYAGVGALTLAGLAGSPASHSHSVTVWLTASAPPVVALGFLTHHPLPQVGGAALMSVGVLAIAGLQLREALTAHPPRRTLLAVSGLAPWVPMALAVTWAASLYWSVPALSIPDMARTHGLLNVVFIVSGLLARRPLLGAAPSEPGTTTLTPSW